jgi:hypothetical protein
MKPIKKPMIRDGFGGWTEASGGAQRFWRVYNADYALAYRSFAVVASDASKVLGPTRTGKAVD